MSLSLNRTLVINEAPSDPTQAGCIPASITTLFEPHSHCSFATNPEKRAAFQLPEAALDWRQVLHGEEDLDSLDVIRLTDTVPRPRGWSWERWELWQAEGWWDRLWAHLVQSGPSAGQGLLDCRDLEAGFSLLDIRICWKVRQLSKSNRSSALVVKPDKSIQAASVRSWTLWNVRTPFVTSSE